MLSYSNSEFFSALSDPTRVKITEMVAGNGQMSAGDISKKFDVTFAAISQHLKVLREAQILLMEKQAQKHLYAINPDTFNDVESWIQKMKKTWQSRFEQLDQLLLIQKGKNE